MKSILFWFLSLVILSTQAQTTENLSPKIVLNKDSIKSSLDGVTQVFYYSKSTSTAPQPLIVQLHSWSYTADSLKTLGLDIEANKKNYNYIFPNFRGVNNHAKACCSEFVINDIDEAIDWALKKMNVNKQQIFVVGYSGGGYATLAMFMRSRHNIRSFSAWASISDIVAWYGESLERKNKYAGEILKCLGATENFDTLKAKDRSPLFWKTPVKKRKKSTLQIFAGIHDGYGFDKPVPISHSVNFYNKMLSDFGEKDTASYVSAEDLAVMLKTQSFPANNTGILLGGKIVHYRKQSKNIMLTIFEGGHDMLSQQALEYIEQVNGIR